MAGYWLGVMGSMEAVTNLQDRLWWCFPPSAKKGDHVFMYCPKSINQKKQGIFALYKITTTPNKKNEKNQYCSGFRSVFRKNKHLLYAELEYLQGFEFSLPAKEMKDDPVLSCSIFIRRNFREKVFKIDKACFNQILYLLKQKQKAIAAISNK